MKSVRLLIIVITLSLNSIACKKTVEGLTVAPELQGCVSEYVQEMSSHGVEVILDDIDIGFASFEASYLGMCTQYGDGSATAHISDEYLTTYGDQLAAGECPTAVRTVVFHELGHCDRGRGHDSALSSSGAHDSYMNPTVLSVFEVTQNKQDLDEELATGGVGQDW